MVRMICKWCGASLEHSGAVCRRCGKEQPALSDCGGFYDLVPSAQVDIPVASVTTQPPVRKQKKTSAALRVVCVLLAAALVAAAMMNFSLANRNRALEREMEEAQEQMPTNPPSTEPTKVEPQSLAQQDVQVTLRLEDQEDSYSMKVAPSHPAQVTVKCEPKPLVASITGYTAVVELTDLEETARAELTLEMGENALTLECALDEALGQPGAEGFVLSAVTYTAEGGAVQPLITVDEETSEDDSVEEPTDEDDSVEEPTESTGQEAAGQTEQPVTVTTEADGANIVLDYAYLRGCLNEKELDADTQLTCTFARVNDRGGSFTVVVEGITVAQDQ